jgi:hypothetical protein
VQLPRAAPSTGLVELVPSSFDQYMPSSSSARRYVLEVSGARLEFGDDFSEPTIRRVVGILRTC